MNRWASSLMGQGVLVAIVFVVVAARADEPAALPPQVSAEQLQEWLTELDSDSYEVREAAAQRLAEVGPAAIDVLSRGVASESAEIAWRSGAALERIAINGDETTLTRIAGVLDGLSAKGRPALRSMAAELHARQKQFRHDRATSSLKQNGAVFSDGMVELGGGPIFLGGVPVAIDAMPFGGPAIIEEVPAIIPEIDPPEAPVDEGIFGVLRRALGGIIKITEEPPPAFDVEGDVPLTPAPDLPPSKIPTLPGGDEQSIDPPHAPQELRPAREAPAEEPAPPKEEPKTEQSIPEPAPPPAVQAGEGPAEAVEILEADGIIEGGDIAVPAMAMDFIGEDIDADVGVQPAALVLGPQWRGGDDGLKVLKDVPEIWSISLDGAKITDESLKYIAELPNLSSLTIRQVNVSRHGLRKLREQKPDLQVQARGEAMLGVNGDLGTSPLVLTSVFDDSGAYRAGLREGDAISTVDGVGIKDFADLTISIYGRKPGEKIRVEYEREGTKKTTEVTLTKRGDNQ